MRIYVFSFNRGQFLDNCLRSIDNCIPGHEVYVIDDNSHDPLTRQVLKQWSTRFNVHTPVRRDGDKKVGGLNRNMQWALDHAVETDTDFALFIQDDMQMVRRVDPDDLEAVERFFDANPDAILFQPCFMKRCDIGDETEKTKIDRSGLAYLRTPGHARQRGFSDVGVFHPARVRDLMGPIVGGEGDNNRLAEHLDLVMGVAVNPFMMWLPMPISHRSKRRNPMLRLQEWLSGGGFHPCEIMDEETGSGLIDRDAAIRPFAEDWLKCPGVERFERWAFVGGRSALLEMGGWRQQFARILYLSKTSAARLKRIPENTINLAVSVREALSSGGPPRKRKAGGERTDLNSLLMIRKVDKPFGEAQYGYDLLIAYCSWSGRPLVLSHQTPISPPPAVAGFRTSQPQFIAPPRRLRRASDSLSQWSKADSIPARIKARAAYLFRWFGVARRVRPHTIELVIRNHFPGPEEQFPDPTFPNARTLLFVHSMPDFFEGRTTDYDIQWACRSLQNADGLVFVSRLCRQEWNKQTHLSNKPQYVLGNTCRDGEIGRMLRRPKQVVREALGLGEAGTIFVNMATLQERKAQIELVRSLADGDLFDKTDSILLMIGFEQQPYSDNVKRLISERGLEDRVQVLGPKPNALEYLRAADYTIQSSKSESFGRVLLESQALGVPVVSTRVGVAEEIIQHGRNGFIIDNLPDPDVAQLLVSLCNKDNVGYQNLSNESYGAYQKGFDNKSFIKQFYAILDDFRSFTDSRRPASKTVSTRYAAKSS